MISKREAEEMRARWEAATPGPWGFAGRRHIRYQGGTRAAFWHVSVNHPHGPWEAVMAKIEADARFIAHARVDHPATLAALEEAMECFEGLLEHHDVQCNFRNREGCECWACVSRELVAKWRGKS